ncbi:hypothetical protein IWW39_002910 [Coemansia spiralis]|uniref:SAM-dependent MTase RsmB/NOP-type domain-containing protein n=1 Tax=Coemansia spiralis TaxID=417178 RepID=A0A9W8L4S3_9FUNG|nr:hypothetical protein IWW39_002910 [Coemansia spiralis]
MLFYERAADILGRLERRQGSLKGLTVGNAYLKAEEKRKMYAVLCETLKHASALSIVIERSGLLEAENIDPRLALVLTHDLLFTRGGLQHQGADPKLNLAIRKHKNRLAKELERLKAELGAESNADLVPAHLCDTASTFRYVRVNLLVTSVDAIIKAFQDDRYRLVDLGQAEGGPMHQVLAAKSRVFACDPDLNDLLVFPPGTDLHAHPLFVNGSIVLQDKASCMPAHVVQPAPGSVALDACAAPGNKTSHMASLMKNRGRIFAFDMDQRRLDTLVQLTGNAKCKIIKAQCTNFLDVDPLDPSYADVEYALLDPSCSGSGIVNRQDALVDSYIAIVNPGGANDARSSETRAQNLAEFQTSIVLHAMRFPGVKRISYSTCSVHAEENEGVVARVLQSQSEFGLAAADQVIPTWPRRGLETAGLTKEQAACVVRTMPEDGTNGFFVAGFVRLQPADIASTREQLAELRAARQKEEEARPKSAAYASSALDAKKAKNALQAKKQKQPREPRQPRVKAPKQAKEGAVSTMREPLPMVVASGAVIKSKAKGKRKPKRRVSVAITQL